MKKYLKQIAIMAINGILIGTVLQTFFLSLVMASDLGAQSIQSVRDVVIHGEYKNASIKECFNAIEKNTNYTFNYNEDDLNDTVRINFKSKNKYVSDFLLEISKKSHLKFRQVNNTINVQQLDESDNKKPSVEVIIQGITITGRVISSEDNEGLPGANVIVKGTSQGTVTDFEGYYKLDVPDENTVLVFSSVGYVLEEVNVGNQTVINMTMTSDITALSEIVITALGIGREQASLGYAVAQVDGDELTSTVQENVLNSLSGKVTGVTISSTGGTGSSVSMIIRGATSLANDNQPLFVVDGVPIQNTLNNGGGFGQNNRVDYGNAISDLNPDDIESMSVLKGASAAALYGSRAGNGVVIITTKSGKKSKGLGVSVSSSTVFDLPYKYFPNHTLFANGQRPETPGSGYTINEGTASFAGPELDKGNLAIQWPYSQAELSSGIAISKPLESHDNNKNFYETAITSTNSVSIMDQTERLDYRLSYTNMYHRGMIPNTDLGKNSISTSATFKTNDHLTISSNLNFTISGADNRPSTDKGTNPIWALNQLNSHIDVRDLETVWLPGQEGLVQNMAYSWNQRDNPGSRQNNPYFLAYQALNSFERNRVYGNVKAEYKFNDNLSFMIRYNADNLNEIRETKISKGYTEDRNGTYGIVNIHSKESNADFLLSYNKSLNDWDFNSSVGGNIMQRFGSSNRTYSAARGAGLITPEVFTVGNINPSALRASSGSGRKQINSIYALASFGYKNMAYLDITARNDWSSTLPKENNSYFYPSFSASLLLNEMFDMGNQFPLVKLRAGWAKVGNDTNPYNLVNTIGTAAPWGSQTQVTQSTSLLTPDLKPEENTSIEIGTDLALFENRLRAEFTYYTSDNRNQIIGVQIPNSSGFSRKNINAGLISSTGIEASLGATIIENSNWTWDAQFNYSRNRTVIEELVDGLDFVEFWNESNVVSVGYVGEEIGTLMARKTLTRVDDPASPYHGWPLIDNAGYYTPENDLYKVLDENGKRTAEVAGNFNPDFQLGLQTSVSYKNFSLSATFDWRSGGQFLSMSMRYANSDVQTQYWIDNMIDLTNVGDVEAYIRANEEQLLLGGDPFPMVGGPTAELGGFPFDKSGVSLNDGSFLPGVMGSYDDDGNFTMSQEQLGGPGTKYIPFYDTYPWSLGAPSMFYADFIKLRDISFSYSVPSEIAQKLGLQNMSVAVFSRNILLWTKAGIGVDPENAFRVSGSGFQQGIERANSSPFVLPIGFKLNLSF